MMSGNISVRQFKNMKLDNTVAHSVEASRCNMFSSYTVVCLTFQLKVHMRLMYGVCVTSE